MGSTALGGTGNVTSAENSVRPGFIEHGVVYPLLVQHIEDVRPSAARDDICTRRI